MKSSTYARSFCIPFIFLLALFTLSGGLLSTVKSLYFPLEMSHKAYQLMETLIEIPYWAVIIGFVFFTRKKEMKKMVMVVVGIIAVLLLVSGLLIEMKWTGLFPCNWFDSWVMTHIKEKNQPVFLEVFHKWDLFIMYLLTSLLSPVFFSVLAWGLINQFTKLKEAIRFYIPIAILSLFLADILGFTSALYIPGSKGEASTLYFITVLCLILSILIVKMIHPVAHDEEEEVTRHIPFLRLGFLFAGIGMVSMFLSHMMRVEFSRIFSEKNLFIPFFHEFSISVAMKSTLVMLLVLFLGSFFMKRFGWKKVVVSTLVLLMATFLFVFYALFHGERAVLVFGYSRALVSGLSTALLLPAFQMIYLTIESSERWMAKSFSELVLSPVFRIIGKWIESACLFFLGSVALLPMYLVSISFLVLVLLIVFVYSIARKRSSLCKL